MSGTNNLHDRLHAITASSPDVKDLYDRGMTAFAEKHYREAIECFTRCLKEEPRNLTFLMARVDVHMAWNDRPRAIVDLTTALKIKPDRVDWLRLRAKMLALQKQYTEAITDLDCAFELEPKNVSILTQRALCHIEASNTSAALADFDLAIHLEPENARTYELSREFIVKAMMERFGGLNSPV